jgi:hypothetical protein
MSSCCSPILVWLGGGKERAAIPLNDLPQLCIDLVLGRVPLRKLAHLACLSKELHLVYLDRVKERDEVVAARLDTDFQADFRERLLPADTALPRDLIVDPPVRCPSLKWHYFR